jgi:ABC-type antimicrobial peptide transport system permease subunit
MLDRFEGEKQTLQRGLAFAVRSPRAGSRSFMNEVQERVWSVNPDVPVAEISTLGELYTKSMARTSFTLVMLCVAGSMALLLGIVGIYGVISYSVSQRTREIGIRMALGAQRQDVLRLVLGQGARIAFFGVAIGLAAAAALARLLSSLLFSVSASDPLTFAAVAVLLIAVALLACYIPARRALRVDPIIALRYE